jgi:hypothetical protein
VIRKSEAVQKVYLPAAQLKLFSLFKINESVMLRDIVPSWLKPALYYHPHRDPFGRRLKDSKVHEVHFNY